MSVPRERDDDAYFLPLRDLKISPETELFLGLVHDSDGAEGARRRITAASKVRPAFGIATECGMARARTKELVLKLLRHSCRSGARQTRRQASTSDEFESKACGDTGLVDG